MLPYIFLLLRISDSTDGQIQKKKKRKRINEAQQFPKTTHPPNSKSDISKLFQEMRWGRERKSVQRMTNRKMLEK